MQSTDNGLVLRMGPMDSHRVHFFSDSARLAGQVSAFLRRSLNAGGAALAIVRPTTLALLEGQLARSGVDVRGTREAGIIIGGIGVGGVLFTVALPMMLRTMGQTLLMVLGGVVATAGLIGLALELPWAAVAFLFTVTGFGYMMLHNSIQTQSVELAPTARSSSYSMHAFFFFTGQSLGPILFGLVQHGAGAFSALVACSILFAATGIIAGLVFARLARR